MLLFCYEASGKEQQANEYTKHLYQMWNNSIVAAVYNRLIVEIDCDRVNLEKRSV
jgi:hypothetical protein